MLMQWLWRSIAGITLGLGAIGVLLPGLPTTPFLLIAVWAAARGWPELEERLLQHPHYGPLIHDWREHRAVPRRAKWLASLLMASSMLMIWLLPAPMLVRWLLSGFLPCLALWLWTRPEP